YADYAVWQRARLAGAPLAELLATWREALAGAPALLEVPTDRPRRAPRSPRGGRVPVALPAPASAALRERARAAGATPFMLLLAGFQALLGRWSGQDDVVVGTPIANRNQLETEPLIGLFVNTLALRSDLEGDPGFEELTSRTRRAALAAFARQDLPFERLVEELAPVRDLRATPLFQALFTLQNAPAGALRLPGLAIEMLEIESDVVKFDLGLTLSDGAEFEGELEYAADLFDRATAARLAAQFGRLLAVALAEPVRPLSDVPLFDEAERCEVLAAGIGPAAPEAAGSESALHAAFFRRAATAPDAIALEAGPLALSYGGLAACAERIAARLIDAGVGPEVVVAVLLERSAEGVATLLGVLRAGGVYLPLDPAHPEERLRRMLADARAAVVVTRPELWALVAERNGSQGPVPMFAADGEGHPAPRRAVRGERVAGAEQAAYAIYTSGSTGGAKGVVVSHGVAAEHGETILREWGLGPADRELHFASPAFDIALEQVLPALGAGATLVLRGADLPTPAELFAELSLRSVTIADLPTAFLEQ